MSEANLFSEFPEISAKAWKQHIQYNLNGEDYNTKMIWESLEGIKVKPFYTSSDLKGKPVDQIPKNKEWKIGQTIYAGNAILANEKALHILERGAESLVFIVPSTEIKIEHLLKDIYLKQVTIYFELQFLSLEYVHKILDFIVNTKAKIYLNTDIIGNLAKTGNWFFNLKEDHRILHKILQLHSYTICIDASLYQNAGANITQQLGYALAQANEYLNILNNQKEITKENQHFTFKVAVGSNYFFEIAKIKALRILWSLIATEYNIKTDCTIITVPTKRNKVLYDYNTNMLRTTTECMSAILGSANVICNLPYDSIFHKDNEFGERIARNQLILLKEEAFFNKNSNAVDGTYYIESLTNEIAEKALVLFKKIETNGGFLKQLKEHAIQKSIKESATKEQNLFNEQKEVLVGSNKYINTSDTIKSNLEIYPFIKTKIRKTLIEPILEKRISEILEQKRLENE